MSKVQHDLGSTPGSYADWTKERSAHLEVETHEDRGLLSRPSGAILESEKQELGLPFVPGSV